jgi:hypothetical protein
MEENRLNNSNSRNSPNIWIGLIFIAGGAIILLNQLGILPTRPT